MATTNTPLLTMCRPKAAGSFSSGQYSDIVKVKLLRHMPLKKPQIDNHIIKGTHSDCSANTGNESVKFSCG